MIDLTDNEEIIKKLINNDRINNMPFYIGKGKKNRAYEHLTGKDKKNIQKLKMIETIRILGLEPRVDYIMENIENEKVAYKIEYTMIKRAIELGINLTNKVLYYFVYLQNQINFS